MSTTVLLSSKFSTRLFRRGLSYSVVGVATYVLDLSILFLLTSFSDIPQEYAVALGFIVGISTNYFICYHFIYKGTERNVFLGYLIFAGLAVTGISIIVPSVSFLTETFDMNLLLARTVAAALVGTLNFLINTFFNFRLL